MGVFFVAHADWCTYPRLHVCLCRLFCSPHFRSHSSSNWSMRSDRSRPSPSSSRRRLASRLMERRIRMVMFAHSGSDRLPLWWPVRGLGPTDVEMDGFGPVALSGVFLRRLSVPENLLSDMGQRLLSYCGICLPAAFCPWVINSTDRNAFRCSFFETLQARDHPSCTWLSRSSCHHHQGEASGQETGRMLPGERRLWSCPRPLCGLRP
jgi:hypothetical protein